MAAAGDNWAVDRLLERPGPGPELRPYWEAFVDLGRDRPKEAISLGMAGGMSLPGPVPLDAIRDDGRRRGFDGAGFDDFVEIVRHLDDLYVEATTRKAEADTKATLDRMRRGGR